MIGINDIRNWPEKNKKECELFFPELIRKLIFESGKGKITSLEINIGDGTAYAGFDGILEIDRPILNFPKGKYVLEIGTDTNIKSKCNSDYLSSKIKGKDLDHKDTTYVFLTPRLFSKSKSWIKSKKREKFWKELIVINASTLESWLSVCPVTSMWLAVDQKLVFGHPHLETIETFWRRHFTFNQNKIAKHNFVIGNRTMESETLLESLKVPGINIVKSSSHFESLCFAVASISNLENSNRFCDATILVHSHEILRDSATFNGTLIFICTFFDITWFKIAIQNGHSIIYPTYNIDSISIGNILDIPYLDKSSFTKSLQNVNISYEESHRLASRSFCEVEMLLHLMDMAKIDLLWNDRNSIKLLLPSIILGSWEEDFDGDKAAIEILSGLEYLEFIEKIDKFINTPRSPIIKQGNLYKFKYQFLAWNIIETQHIKLESEVIDVIASEIFLSDNPILAISPKERPYANLNGIRHSYSNSIYENFLHSLIIISLSNVTLDNFTPKTLIDHIVTKILVSEQPQIWKTNSSYLKLIAEASPDVFVKTIHSKLEQSDTEIYRLFEEETDAFIFPNVYHTDLLRAFEALSWYPEYFEESIFCFAIMASKDPGGTVSNRPINSLFEIFKPWNPQTTVDETNRIKVLKRLNTFAPDIVKKILFSIINYDKSGMLNSTFIYRPIPDKQSPVNFKLSVELAVNQFLEFNDLSETDLELICNSSFNLPSNQRLKLVQLLNVYFTKNKTLNGLHTCLGLNISHHLQFSESDWALPTNELKGLLALYNSQSKNYPNTELMAAFSNRPFFLNKKKQGDLSSFEKLFNNRLQLLKKIYKNNNFQDFISLISLVEDKYIYGNVLGKLLRNVSEINEFLYYCVSNPDFYPAIQGFAARKAYVYSEDWVIKKYKELIKKRPQDEQLLNLIIGISPSIKIWNFIDSLEDQLFNTYWHSANASFWNLNSKEIEYGIDNLYKVNRGNAIINICWMAKSKIATTYLLRVLLDLGNGRLNLISQINQYEITAIINELYQRDLSHYEDIILDIEFIYFDLLSGGGSKIKYPKHLLRKISTDEKFMMDLITWAFKPDTETNKESLDQLEEIKNRAIIAWKILYNLEENTLINDPDNLDTVSFNGYVRNLRVLGSVHDRLNKVDSYIGKILGLVKIDENWPPSFLCEILETVNSEPMLRGFETALYNGSGTKSYWGSGINRNLRKAKRFKEYSDKIRFDYPIVSKSLENVSKSADNSAMFWENKERQDWIKGY